MQLTICIVLRTFTLSGNRKDMKLSGIKVLENEGGAVPNRTQRPQIETIAVNDYVGNGDVGAKES